jgi:hypothetical protein
MTIMGPQIFVSAALPKTPLTNTERPNTLLLRRSSSLVSAWFDKMDLDMTPSLPKAELVLLQRKLQAALPDVERLCANASGFCHELSPKIQEVREATARLSSAEHAAGVAATGRTKELRRLKVSSADVAGILVSLQTTAAKNRTTVQLKIQESIKKFQDALEAAEAAIPGLTQTAKKISRRRMTAWNDYLERLGDTTSRESLSRKQESFAKKQTKARKAERELNEAKKNIRALQTKIRVYELLSEQLSHEADVLAAKELLADAQNGLRLMTSVAVRKAASGLSIFESGIFADLAEMRPRMQETYFFAAELNNYEIHFAGSLKQTAASEKMDTLSAQDRKIREQEAELVSRIALLRERERTFSATRKMLSASMILLADSPAERVLAAFDRVQKSYSEMVLAAQAYLKLAKGTSDYALRLIKMRERAYANVARLKYAIRSERSNADHFLDEPSLDSLSAASILPRSANPAADRRAKPSGDWRHQYPI